MWIQKSEKACMELILQHMETVGTCTRAGLSAFTAFLNKETARAAEKVQEVSDLETQADAQVHGLCDLLFAGAFLPSLRRDLFALSEHLDRVANAAEALGFLLVREEPEIPDSLAPLFVPILESTHHTLDQLQEAVQAYFSSEAGMEAVRQKTRAVRAREHEVDERESELIQTLFRLSIDKASKVHLRSLIAALARVSDACEDAADRLEVLAVQSIA